MGAIENFDGRKDLEKINPSHFKTGSESVLINIDGVKVLMQPNHPVESISWDVVKEFIDRLNDLSNHGDKKVQELLAVIFLGHQEGNIYDFPTNEQWEFVMRNRGKANKNVFNLDDATDLSKYAWYNCDHRFNILTGSRAAVPVATVLCFVGAQVNVDRCFTHLQE